MKSDVYNINNMADAIHDWANRTFPTRKPEQALTKLVLDEIPELLQHKKQLGTSDIGLEWADCMILLLDLARIWEVDIPLSIWRKMEINEHRMWARDEGTGTYSHVVLKPDVDFSMTEIMREEQQDSEGGTCD